MIARPKISRNEWKSAEISAFEVGNFAPFSYPGFAIFTQGVDEENRAFNYASLAKVVAPALSEIEAFSRKMVGPALHASVRVLVNGPTKRAADALGRHADKRMWRKKYPWLKQVRLIVATAACIVHFTVMVMDDKGRAVPSFGVFASVFKDVAAYEAYFLVATSAGQAAVGYINVYGKRLALKVFHRIVGINYWRNVLVLTWLVNDDQEADETRRRLKTHLLDASALPESTLVAPSPEALRAWLLRHNRSEYVAMGEAARLATNLRMRGGAAPWHGEWQFVPGKPGHRGPPLPLHLSVDDMRQRERDAQYSQATYTCAGCHQPFSYLTKSERCRTCCAFDEFCRRATAGDTVRVTDGKHLGAVGVVEAVVGGCVRLRTADGAVVSSRGLSSVEVLETPPAPLPVMDDARLARPTFVPPVVALAAPAPRPAPANQCGPK